MLTVGLVFGGFAFVLMILCCLFFGPHTKKSDSDDGNYSEVDNVEDSVSPQQGRPRSNAQEIETQTIIKHAIGCAE